MEKIVIIITVLYLLYYGGNIIYDLLLKKEIIVITDETEEFTLSDFAEKNKEEIQGVGIEDVENLNTPKSFTTNSETISVKNDSPEERPDIDEWREKFEAEENIDRYDSNPHPPLTQHQKEKPIPKSTDWKKMLNLAETSVQVIANNNGHKVYQSTM
ncbi:hypothetical protein [Elizabethkingia miricola]|uniref:hypothetical protein n=2 Tax=Elizabethkingia miricola TaxID=172045 RepID=UPI000B35D1C8|nr:hypothetical protein [Elizabethkingia miricola]NHQ68392.1 hypothetical protein [Elizabethkingia miricola]NHQ72407.1 hypothetical protein [Elizabethkingia miricola]NHQ77904.1 hypothetical protein [Elizabethkingia miricola]PSL86843.1 hypothetical protein C7V10_18405 [Elizabethkingia miricola]QHQ85807.1 hypothetical protein FE632_02925 [Elizabethkingia miricola]